MKEGKKHDQGKTRLDLIPVEALEALGKVLTMGAEKYGDHNWREGINYSRVYGAAQRHLQAFWGEDSDIDEESKLSHLSHAFCNLAFLLTYETNKERYQPFDDRAGSNNGYYKERERTIDDIIELVFDNNAGLFNAKAGDSCLKVAYNTLLNATRTLLHTDDPPFGYPDLTKMTHPEACKYLKPGMKVKVLCSGRGFTRGWKNNWNSEFMDKYIDSVLTVELKDTHGVNFAESDWCSFPAFVLEIISEKG